MGGYLGTTVHAWIELRWGRAYGVRSRYFCIAWRRAFSDDPIDLWNNTLLSSVQVHIALIGRWACWPSLVVGLIRAFGSILCDTHLFLGWGSRLRTLRLLSDSCMPLNSWIGISWLSLVTFASCMCYNCSRIPLYLLLTFVPFLSGESIRQLAFCVSSVIWVLLRQKMDMGPERSNWPVCFAYNEGNGPACASHNGEYVAITPCTCLVLYEGLMVAYEGFLPLVGALTEGYKTVSLSYCRTPS